MKRSIFVKEPNEHRLISTGLVQLGEENYSGAINTALERYFRICMASRPVLSIGEWEAIKDALDWNVEGKRRSIPFLEDPRELPILFEDYLDCPDFLTLKRKHPLSGLGLLEKLKAMSYPQLVSVIQSIESEENLKTKRLQSLVSQENHPEGLEPLWPDVVGWEHCGVDPEPCEEDLANPTN